MKNVQKWSTGKIPSEETGIEIRKSICSICDPGPFCGLDLFVKDDKIIKVEGNEKYPTNRGTLCVKGAALRQYVYHEDRIKTPLKRIGPKGSGRFEAISWDEALETIAERFNGIKQEYGPESVAFFSGYAKFFRPYLKRLAHSFGSPNYITESSTCYQAQVMAQKLVYGTPTVPDTNTRCILIWTSNPFYSNVAGGRALLRAKERGVKLIIVDPRKTPTTAIADLHLQLRPGTDGALALAFANVIINEKLYDEEFVEQYTYGFEEYKEYVQQFPPEKAEELTGVPADDIKTAARTYASLKPAAIMPSASPVSHNTNGVQNYRAIFSLIGLTANCDSGGGNLMLPISYIHTPARIVTREQEFTQSRPWDEMAPRIGSDRFPVWIDINDEEGQSMHLPFQIRSGKPYPIKGVIGFGLNYQMWPDSDGMINSLKQLDFFVNVDLFMTNTCKNADIILPACSSVERSELRCLAIGYIILTQPAIKPVGEARCDVDIIYELAEKLGLDDSLFKAGFEASIDWILEPSGITVQELKKHPEGMHVPNPVKVPQKKYLEDGFSTLSGKLEFKSKALEKYNEKPGFESLPVYHPPKMSRESSPDLAEGYPFILNTGSRLPMFLHSRTHRLSWITSLRPNHLSVDMNPDDAARLGIKQNDNIRLSTPKNSIVVKVNLTQMAQPGVVHIIHGHPKIDINILFEGDYLDPLSGFPGFKSSLCNVEKV